MPRITLSPQLKTQIKNLPEKEKDKLLLRLIPANTLLVEQLQFQLLENEETTEIRRAEVVEKWEKTKSLLSKTNWRGSKGPMREFRWISAIVNRHVKVTKDRYGEVVLHLPILRFMFEILLPIFLVQMSFYEEKSAIMLLKRCKKIVESADKLHEDHRLDFAHHIVAIGELISKSNALKLLAKSIHLDISKYEDY